MARFHNLEPFARRGPLDILKWKLVDTIAGRRRSDRSEPFATPFVDNDGARLRALEPSLTWIGHATYVLRLGGLVAHDHDALLAGPGRLADERQGVTARRHHGVDLERRVDLGVRVHDLRRLQRADQRARDHELGCFAFVGEGARHVAHAIATVRRERARGVVARGRLILGGAVAHDVELHFVGFASPSAPDRMIS